MRAKPGQELFSMRVASYNIRKARGLDNRRDPARILSVTAALGADIVALQEADRRFGRRVSSLPAELVAQNTDLVALSLANDPQGLGWHGNALLVRKDAIVLRQDRITLPGLEPRGAVLVDLHLGGQRLRVVGVHLGLRSRDRRAQALHLALVLSRLPAMPTVMLGDFNEWSVSGRNLMALNGQLALMSPGKSFPAPRPLARLDRIAVSRDLAVRDSGVHRCVQAIRASDHLPVWADLVQAEGLPVLQSGSTDQPALAERPGGITS